MVGKPTNPNEKAGGGGGRLFSPRNSATRNSQQNGYLSSPNETNETPYFKLLTEQPPSDNIPACLKYYIQLEDQLRTLSKMKTGAFQIIQKDWNKILNYIDNSLKASRIIFAMDSKYYLRKEIDVRSWKYCIYYFITVFRNELAPANKKPGNPIEGMLCGLIQMGILHFKDLIFASPCVLNLDLKPVYSQSAFIRGSTQKEDPTAEEELVYRLFVALGDLHRYRFEIDKSQRNVKLAIDMYTCARFIDTEKSRAYNQLGLMAKQQGDAMGVIYNFTRAWHVSNPTAGAREQMLYIYDDLYKLYNLNKPTFWFTNMKTADVDLERVKPFEIWVLDTQKYNKILASERKVPPLRREHLNSLSDDTVFSRFNFIYGHFLGMLYTKIGTEALEHVGKEMLIYLEGMVMVKNMNKFTFYIQAIAMIVFQIDHLTPPRITKDNAPTVAHMDHMRNIAFDGALGISLVLVEKIIEMIELLDWDNPLLATCTAALHVFIWWLNGRHYFLKCLRKRWSAIKKLNQNFSRNPFVPGELVNDIRDNFLNSLFQLYCKFSIRDRRHKSMLFPKFTKEPCGDNSVPLGILPEHIVLDGFAQLVLVEDIKRSTSCYYNSRFTQERACTYFRLKSMTYVCSIIFGPVKSKNLPTKSFEALDHFYYANEFKTMAVIHDKMCGGELLQKSTPTKRQLRPDCNNGRIIVRRPQVEKGQEVLRSKVLLSSNPLLNTVGFEIWSHLAIMGVKGDLVVQPLRVVLDTNVFIHDLNWIEKLIYLLKHPLIIPITVLLELKGLMKGLRKKSPRTRQVQLTIDEQQERMIDSMEIAEKCNHAVEFLERHKKYFRVVNVVGKQIDMYNFVSQKVFDERFESTIRNDEKILETCCHLEALDRKARSLDQPLRILRNTILITGDVSLRVRAMVQDIPTRDIQAFTTWLEEATTTGTPRLTPNIRRRIRNRTPRR